MCSLNSLVWISFNVISVRIAVDRQILPLSDFLHFKRCAPIHDFMHIGRICIAFLARYSLLCAEVPQNPYQSIKKNPYVLCKILAKSALD